MIFTHLMHQFDGRISLIACTFLFYWVCFQFSVRGRIFSSKNLSLPTTLKTFTSTLCGCRSILIWFSPLISDKKVLKCASVHMVWNRPNLVDLEPLEGMKDWECYYLYFIYQKVWGAIIVLLYWTNNYWGCYILHPKFMHLYDSFPEK